MDYNTFVDYAFAHWLDSLQTDQPAKTMCLLGPPGIGKSSTAFALAKRMTDYVRKDPKIVFGDAKAPKDAKAVARLLDFSSMLPEDLNGLPFREGVFTKYCPQEWVGELCAPGAFGVMVLDDLPASANAMQTAGRQSALERRIHDHRFSPGILIIVTGNRREDKSAASTLPAHFRNSVTLLTIDPDVDSFCKWYGAQSHHDGIVTAFLRWKPELLSELPKKASKLGAFATPRQWTSLGRQFVIAEKAGRHILHEIASGLVGDGNAATFCGFVEIHNQLVDPIKVFDDPQGVLPNPGKMLNEASKLVAMSCALGDIAATRCKNGKGATKKDAPEKLLRALSWATAENNEYCAMGVQTFLDGGGNLTHIARVAREKRGDPVISKMLDHLKSALLGA